MSFFYDFLNELNLSNVKDYFSITAVLGEGFKLIGEFEIIDISDNVISFLTKYGHVEITGKDLSVISISKGELCVHGKIKNFQVKDEK